MFRFSALDICAELLLFCFLLLFSQLPYEDMTPLQAAVAVVQKVRDNKPYFCHLIVLPRKKLC